MSRILQEIKAGRILLCDGAMGTQLHRRGLALRECPESWNLSRPADVQAIAEDYLAGGCDIVETNTLGATRPRLAHFGLSGQVDEINRQSARLARGDQNDSPGNG